MDDEEVVTTYTISCEVGSNSLVTFDIVAFECNSAGEKIEQKVIEAIGHNILLPTCQTTGSRF